MTRRFVEVPLAGASLTSIELQQVECDGVIGHIAELHLPSGGLEIYVEPHLAITEQSLRADPAFSHLDLVHVGPADFDAIHCEIGSFGQLSARAVFTDRRGHRIDVEVGARGGSRPMPMFTPAPPQALPQMLRFLTMGDFRLLPTRGSRVRIGIGGHLAEPRPFIGPRTRYTPYLSARSGTDLCLAGLLPTHEGRPLRTSDEPDVDVRITDDGRLGAIGGESVGGFSVDFVPSMPDPGAVDGEQVTGEFTVGSALGRVGSGRWALTPEQGGGVSFELTYVQQDWSPSPFQPARVVLRYARRYRRRGTSWAYRAELQPGPAGRWTSTGSWSVGSAGAR